MKYNYIRKNMPFILTLIKFGIVGVLGTILHTGTLFILVEYFKVEPVFSSVCGFVISLLISFSINLRWTFSTTKLSKWAVFLKYTFVSFVGLLLNLLIMYVTVYYLDLWYLFGQLLVLAVVPINNFILSRFWAFR